MGATSLGRPDFGFCGVLPSGSSAELALSYTAVGGSSLNFGKSVASMHTSLVLTPEEYIMNDNLQ